MRPAHHAFLLLFCCTTSGAVFGQDSTATTGTANADLTAELARLKLQADIAEHQRRLLTSNNATGVTLPTGKIEFDEHQILPSAAKYVTLQAFGDMMLQVCKDIGVASVLVTDLDLRNLEAQRQAAQQQLEQMARGADEAIFFIESIKAKVQAEAAKSIPQPEKGGASTKPTQPSPRLEAFAPALPALLMGLDSIGAVGKSLAGLAGLFKTDYKVSSADVSISAEVIRAALANCPTLTIKDPALAITKASDLTIPYVTDLEAKTRSLRQSLQDAKIALPGYKARIDELEKAKLTTRSDSLKRLVAILEANTTAGDVRLADAQAAIDKLYAVDDKSGISPLVALARMQALSTRYFGLAPTEANVAQLKVTVAYASGTSRISTAWWRNDRIEFSGGLAVTYLLQPVGSDVGARSNTYFVQDTWKRLAVDSETTKGTLRSFGEGR